MSRLKSQHMHLLKLYILRKYRKYDENIEVTKTALTKTTPTNQQNQELKNGYDVKNLLNV